MYFKFTDHVALNAKYLSSNLSCRYFIQALCKRINANFIFADRGFCIDEMGTESNGTGNRARQPSRGRPEIWPSMSTQWITGS